MKAEPKEERKGGGGLRRLPHQTGRREKASPSGEKN
jgi:hypothetical protein